MFGDRDGYLREGLAIYPGKESAKDRQCGLVSSSLVSGKAWGVSWGYTSMNSVGWEALGVAWRLLAG